MRVLQIGGTFVSAQREIESAIHQYLLRQGHDSYILYAYGASEDPHIRRYDNRWENLTSRFMRKYGEKTPRHARASTRRIIRYIKKIRPDVVHLHILHHGYVDHAYLLDFLAEAQIPVVYTMHDFWAATGGCYYYTTAGCRRYQTGCEGCPLPTDSLDCPASRTANALAEKLSLYRKIHRLRFVAVSPWVYNELMTSRLAAYPMDIVYNAAQWRETMGEIQGAPELGATTVDKKFTIIGVAANWDERKGIARFLALAELLGEDYEIRLVGHVPSAWQEAAPANVRCLGSIRDRQALYALYGQADLHVTMSYEETFGLTLIEAAYMGTRSIGFDATAIPCVLHKTYGYVVPSLQVEDMADAIRRLHDHPSDCKLNSEQLSEVREFFSEERMAREYLAVYEQILKQ